jgi:hypothetical protein
MMEMMFVRSLYAWDKKNCVLYIKLLLPIKINLREKIKKNHLGGGPVVKTWD